MKAAVLRDWKSIVITDIEKPTLNDGECLIKVSHAGLCGSDIHVFNGHHATATIPRVLCHEIAGVVAEINGASDLRIGDQVTVEPLISCGKCEACKNGNEHVCNELKLLGIHVDGGFAEYVKADIDKVVKINDIPADIAVLAEPLAVGLHVVRRSGLQVGQTVLIVGGGPIGLTTAIMAKLAGAVKIIISEGNPDRLKLIEELGFDAIDAFDSNLKDKLKEYSEGKEFDVVYEVTGTAAGTKVALEATKVRGTVTLVGFCGGSYEYNHMPIIFKELTVVGCRVYPMQDFVDTIPVMKNIIDKNLFDLRKLISDEMKLDEVEKAIDMMIKGVNLSKIVIEI